MSQEDQGLDKKVVDTIRMLAVDMVEAANSGHPGMPLGAAPMAYVLWSRFLRANPADPAWSDRDRFVLSAGHGSALLYAMLHLAGYELCLDDLKQFRQWESKTPGHPEYGAAPGVEATTGPLGQGFGMGVGMALAERFLSQQFNRPGHRVVDHYTYAIVSDGDLMEGVASEAASLAGTLGLGKLIYLYDDNSISIEGHTDLAFNEDVPKRFQAYGWQTLTVMDGNDLDAIEAAIRQAKAERGRPSLISVKTVIGCGSPKANQSSAHGEPLGGECMAATREHYGWPEEPFTVADDVYAHMARMGRRGQEEQAAWRDGLAAYAGAHPELAAAFEAQMKGELPLGFADEVPVFAAGEKIATRAASGKVLNALARRLPNLVGGSADLAPSTKTIIDGSPDMRPDQAPGGRNIHFGVREHGMGAIVNGMALHGGVIPYGATFFVFSDFVRPALRLAALMQAHSLFVFTHDSVGVGEDGPTHQPIEHLMSLRVMPGMTVLRPADANETAAAWLAAITQPGPACLVLTRQKLPALDAKACGVAEGAAKGGYVVSDCDGQPQIILIGTGSEVHLALAAQKKLADEGVRARVVSLMSWELFREQGRQYMDKVLPPEVGVRLAVEAGATLGWERWVGDRGAVIGLDRFGASAPGGLVMEKLGLSADNVTAKALALLGRRAVSL